jgi:hypothetical protein
MSFLDRLRDSINQIRAQIEHRKAVHTAIVQVIAEGLRADDDPERIDNRIQALGFSERDLKGFRYGFLPTAEQVIRQDEQMTPRAKCALSVLAGRFGVPDKDISHAPRPIGVSSVLRY